LEGFKLSYFHKERQKEAVSAFVLGSEIREESSLQVHQELVWLTYRKNIAITASLHSDVGWGCLIRVAQMAWAHSLQRHFKLTYRPVEKHYVVTAFLEGEGAEFKYGLRRFMEMGARLWQMKPGNWYTMTQAATTLEALHQSSPLKGS
jgi:cysteine protease ATG4